MVDVLVLIEGGGSTRAEQAMLRKGFKALFDKLLGSKPKPSVLCAGGRGQAFKDFKTAVKADPTAVCFLVIVHGLDSAWRWCGMPRALR